MRVAKLLDVTTARSTESSIFVLSASAFVLFGAGSIGMETLRTVYGFIEML